MQVKNISSDLVLNENDELRTGPGSNLGLTVVLDAHNDKLEPLSVSSDFNGFTGVISYPGEFPLTSFKGFNIKPGRVQKN
jgi:hypothetical protein